MSSSPPATNSLEEAQKAAAEVGKQVDEGMTSFARGIARTAALAQASIEETYATAVAHLDHAQAYVDSAVATAHTVEDAAVGGIKGAIAYAAANPYTAYPSATSLLLLALPGTRRLLWRWTLGRLSSPESVIKRSEGRVEEIKGRLKDYTAQVTKLEARLVSGEEELKRGLTTLKSARLELQRLGSQVSSSQGTAERVVRDLRAIKKVDQSLALRGEAAQQAAALKAYVQRINKAVYRIANKDI